MKRRGFLGLLASAAGAFALDPERALWVPGAKTISVPAPRLPMSGVAIARRAKIGDILWIRKPMRFLPNPDYHMQSHLSLGELLTYRVTGFDKSGGLLTEPQWAPSTADIERVLAFDPKTRERAA